MVAGSIITGVLALKYGIKIDVVESGKILIY